MKAIPTTMPAWCATSYGGPGVLVQRQVPVPRIGPRDVLIRVQATTVSAADRRIRALDFPAGMGLIGRLVFGIRRPRQPILGGELAGQIVAVGPKVTRTVVGEDVIAVTGMKMGAHAGFVVLSEKAAMVRRPTDMPLDVAAALSFGGLTARDYLRRAALQPGENVLVIGASGTVGSAFVQLAKLDGAVVTAVTSTDNLPLVRDLGADQVIDYKATDITKRTDAYDIIADCVGALDFDRAVPLLSENGRYLAIAGGIREMMMRNRGSRRIIAGPAAERQDDLQALVDMVAAGQFRPLIDSVMTFADVPTAHAKADTGRKRGSIVIML